jgi:hypothetical protein
VLERIVNDMILRFITQNVPVYVSSGVQVPFVDLAYVELFEYVIYLLLLMDREDLPVRIDAAATSTKNYFSTRMLFDEVRDVIYAGLTNYPFSIGVTIVFWDFGQSDLFDVCVALVRRRLRQLCVVG